MPVNIIDSDVFTDPIVAPADSDPADRTYVLTIAQGLANRTRWLVNMTRSILVATLLQVLDQHDLTVVSAASPDSLFDDGEWFYSTGYSFSGGIVRSGDGVRGWVNPTTPAGTATMDVVAGDGAGVVCGAGIDGEIIRSTNYGDTYAVAEAPNAITIDDMIALAWSVANNLFIVISSTDEIFTSPTGANGTWTVRSTPGGAAGLAGRMAIAASGASAGRIVMANTAGAMYSDNGTSWTQVNFTGGGANGGVCVGWTDADGGHFLLGTADGETWRSADGTSWALKASDVGPTVLGTANDSFGADMVSDLDGTWVALFNATGATAKSSYIYSFDGGVTWTLAPYDGPSVFRSILFSRGRFFFGALGNNGQVFCTPAAFRPSGP